MPPRSLPRVPGQPPPWRRLLRRHRRWLAAGLAAICVLLLVRTVSPPPTPTSPVLVAARDLSPGAPVGAEDVRVADWPPDLVPPGAFSDPADLPRSPLATKVGAGEPLSDIRFLSPALIRTYGAGLVATPVRLADSGTAALLRPGDLVDVLAAAPSSAGAAADPGSGVQPATTVASGVRVLLAGTSRGGGQADETLAGAGDAPDGSLVVLATTTAVAAALAGAAVSYRLSVVLRAG